MNPRPRLPHVTINVASTIDGKLAPFTRRFTPFTSSHDQRLLFELRTRADAVMSGARTIDRGLVDLGPGGKKYRQMRLREGRPEFNLRIVVSGRATLDPKAEIFRHRFSPIIILATERAQPRALARLKSLADDVAVFGEEAIDWVRALAWLRERWNVRRLLCEGGGEVNAGLFAQEVVDEVYWTVAPLVFGGRNAPTMADGCGISNINDATRLRLVSIQRIHDELYLVYRVRKNAPRLRLTMETASETSAAPP